MLPLIALAVPAILCAAEDQPPGATIELGAGVAVASAYPGSSRIAASPIPSFEIAWRSLLVDTATFRAPFAGARWRTAGGDLDLVIGGVGRFGRSNGADPRLHGQTEIDPTLAAGAMAAWAPGQSLVQLRGYAVQDVLDSGEGFTATGELLLRAPPQPWLLVQAGGGMTWANRRHMQAYFGTQGGTVADPGEGTDAAAGWRSAHALIEGIVPVTSRIDATFQVSVGWLVGDAERSPLTAERTQLDSSLSLAYRF